MRFWLRRHLTTAALAVAVAASLAQSSPQRSGSALSNPLSRVDRPREFQGPPVLLPKSPPAAILAFYARPEGRSADPDKPETVGPAIEALSEILQRDPNPDLYLFRGTFSCAAGRPMQSVLEDLDKFVSLRSSSIQPTDDPFLMPRSAYALRGKINFSLGRFDAAMADLDTAVGLDLSNAKQTFNDGGVVPIRDHKTCVWTQNDLEDLAVKFPTDYRPSMYLGLYLSAFSVYSLDYDESPIIEAFRRASTKDPTAALPHFFLAQLYIGGSIAGLLSKARAACLDFVEPRTKACLDLDDLHRDGATELTRAIALDTKLEAAYELRAEAYWELKEYRQALRDYTAALDLLTPGATARRGLFNDRGQAEMQLGQLQDAVADFTKSIALGCHSLCSSYDNRAEAFSKLHAYASAVEDITSSIKEFFSNGVFLMSIEQFRRIYPEYDGESDQSVCEALRSLFFPGMPYATFAKQFLIDATGLPTATLPDLYLKRGDAYAASGNTSAAEREYDRVTRAFPEVAAYSFDYVNGKRIRRK